MTLSHIAIFTLGALLYGAFVRPHWRGWVLMIASIIALYWLQPFLPIRYLDYILPTLTIALTVVVWRITQTPQAEDRFALVVIVVLIIGMSAMRYLAPELRLTPSRPPDTLIVAAVVLIIVGFGLIVQRAVHEPPLQIRRFAIVLVMLLIVALFVVLKASPLAAGLSSLLRTQTGQDVTLASPLDIGWLGFSYVAFRLLHVLRDRQTGKLPILSLREHMTYVVFFPAFTAGPIDRAERFVKDERALSETPILIAPRLLYGGERIAIGLFKKFVLADSLALIALDATNAAQTNSTGWLWVLLYAYALRLYFDFGGYTDIAIGIGYLYGITLPENFDRPYLKPSLAAFWQSWHITLSHWARFYVFSPLSRALIMRKFNTLQVVFASQLATMIVIGLWHGITLNFLIWGIWHGVGLFVHKLWSDRTRQWYMGLKDYPRRKQAWTIMGALLTFHYVALGWVWFALPETDMAARVLLRLFAR